MTLEGAVIKEQGVTFAVVAVRRAVIQDSGRRAEVARELGPAFGGIPIVLMAQDHKGVPTFWGRRDIARFMSGVPLEAVRWQRYTLN